MEGMTWPPGVVTLHVNVGLTTSSLTAAKYWRMTGTTSAPVDVPATLIKVTVAGPTIITNATRLARVGDVRPEKPIAAPGIFDATPSVPRLVATVPCGNATES